MPELSLNIPNLLILFGSFQGIILGLILVTTQKLRKPSNYYLAVLLVTFSLLNLKNILGIARVSEQYMYLKHLPLLWVSLIPVCLYFFIAYLTNPNFRWQRKYYLYFIPFLIELCVQISFYMSYMNTNDPATLDPRVHYKILNLIEIIAAVCTILVSLYSIRELAKYETRLYDNYSEIEDHNLSWLKKTLIGGIALSITWVALAFSDINAGSFNYYLSNVVWIGLSILIYWTGYSMIIRQGLLHNDIFAVSNVQSNPHHTTASLSHKTNEHYDNIIRLIEEEKLYRDPDFNMSLLADKAGLSNGYVSQIINQKRKQNFFEFINSYRVNEVIQQMNNPKYEHYTLVAIAHEAGFKSKSTFNAVFKKITKKTPSQYRKSLQS